MLSFRQRADAATMSEGKDLRQRRTALQTELEALGVQREHSERASSFARSRQRAGVTALDESELGRLADATTNDDDAFIDLRRRIASIDEELGRGRSGGGFSAKGRRIVGWLRD